MGSKFCKRKGCGQATAGGGGDTSDADWGSESYEPIRRSGDYCMGWRCRMASILDDKGAWRWWQGYRAWKVWDGRCGVVTVQGENEEDG